MKPLLLDLFCGAGGAAMGYHRAGFNVVGIDCAPQPNYPFDFYQTDANALIKGLRFDLQFQGQSGRWYGLEDFQAIHASPPCQDHSTAGRGNNGTGWMLKWILEELPLTGKPWVCENVVGKDVKMNGSYFVLCGSMFGMKVRRHRRFGSSESILTPTCNHKEQGRPYTITGNGASKPYKHSLKPPKNEFPKYMDMEWATPDEAAQGIPPAYTEFIGAQLLERITANA